ncbi:SAM domain-containing protein [Xylariales sp. AK1849]|nr:SAM domain-containing protein [Xylariales sp. AK1849]
MVNGNSGLFPEVYTRAAPKGVNPTTPAPKSLPAPQPSSINGTLTEPSRGTASATAPSEGRPGISHTPTSSKPDSTPVTLPLNATQSESSLIIPANPAPLASKSFSGPAGYSGLGRLQAQNQDSPVLHETLTVIDEHMHDLHSTPSNSALHNATDSSSEYSAPLHDRLSYIQGEETDEEDEDTHTRSQVEAWNADDVAEYLFTTGVEKKHCEVFRDQEISGEVLLGMDQSSLFLKAFDLGSVGRRLKTWQKIKSLQDEVNGIGQSTRRTTQNYGSDAGSVGSKRLRSRANTLTNSQNLSTVTDRTGSTHARRLSQTTAKLDSVSPVIPVSPKVVHDSPTRPTHYKRPSAASVRDLHHSRRHSSTDHRPTGTTSMTNTPKMVQPGTFPQNEAGTHKKQPSFDRNWTMGNASNGSISQRPQSSSGFHDLGLSHLEEHALHDSPLDLDRGYFSGTEVEGRKRNVLKKRDTISGHSAKSSYADEQRVRSATALSRHSRFGSVDSVGLDSMPGTAAQKYYGISNPHRRTASTATTESIRPVPPSKDYPSPTVTKLLNGAVEGDPVSPVSPATRQTVWQTKPAKMSGFGGLRAISDAVTGNERAKFAAPGDGSLKESPIQSPSTRTGSSSFELDSPDAAKSPLSATAAGSQGRKPAKKTKKETSAYLRGLAKVGPKEAIKDADYSGWMKKKSSNVMTTWKPRLFVLKGRRLAYYYSEDDTEEKGLIDISFHRVLPADNERLTALHATLTGASNTPMVPVDSSLQTGADNSSAPEGLQKGDDSMFIFKLMPPRAGLSRAVTFTKPTVHYFAVPNLQQGRAWMAALMKATIDRDDTKPMTSTYQQKTISLAKARQMRHRPPALMNLDEKVEEGIADGDGDEEKKDGLGISFGEVDSAISGLEKLGLQGVESASARKPTFDSEKSGSLQFLSSPQSA